MPKRPQPVSITDELLVHVLDALDEIRDRLPAPKAEPSAGATKVSEPAKRAPAKKAAAKKAAAPSAVQF